MIFSREMDSTSLISRCFFLLTPLPYSSLQNLTSLVDSIDRLNQFLANQTKMMIESMTRAIEDAFKVGESKEKMMNTVNATIEQAKEVIIIPLYLDLSFTYR